ncbi:transporter substrate-binding domain-containing protein [Sporosarcina sp. G11-34]|uniref:transporter substrate-binding domain-containing protein n=1 Tax=Sporosarcina sp. G11-34 TaxID=2849605 RepID=UPI0022A95ADA|nr:transporter substrate-binding domain-containing protein [Sporosarcina sp. G11-34]MCZ2258332.1 transporter substrate-binding domain-containing protein [Sporosarcina sp. G11-34]
MKKWSGIAILLLLMMSVLAACGTKNEEDGEKASSANKDSDKKVLTMATSADYPPFEYVDTAVSEEIIGFDIDLAKMIAEELGYDLVIEDMDFNGLIPALQAKSIDFVIAGMDGNDEERKKVIDFSAPYFTPTNLVITMKDLNIEKPEDLAGKKVGAQTASIQEKGAVSIEETYGYTVESRDRVPDLFQEIRSGHLDAIVIADAVANGYLDASEDLSSFELPVEHKPALSIAFQKGSALTAEFDRVLKELQDNGKIDELSIKWFGN